MCPGQERCAKYQTAQNPERACEQCGQNVCKTKLHDIEGGFGVIPWVRHILWLYAVHQAGATFFFSDLSKREWDGLMMIDGVRGELEQEQLNKQKEKNMLAQASNASVRRI